MKRISAFAFVLLACLATAALAAPKPAPDFKLKGLDGKPVALSQYRGKVVLLDFWATWCPPCRAEIPGFVDLQKRYGKQGLQVIGLSLDQGDPADVATFVKNNKINYPVAIADQKVSRSYGGIVGIPTTFLIDRHGRIAQKYIGYHDRRAFEKDFKPLLKQK